MNDLMTLFEKNLLEHFLEQEAVSEKRKEEDYDEVIIIISYINNTYFKKPSIEIVIFLIFSGYRR